MNTEIYPKGWPERFEKSLDFKWAYEALEGYEHFHTYTLRAYIRLSQLRPDEALELLDEAESRFTGFDSPINIHRFFFCHLARLDVRMLQEALEGTVESILDTDRVIEKILNVDAPDNDDTRRIRNKASAVYHLNRGNFNEANEVFNLLVKDSNGNTERQILSYIGASASTHELGLYKKSRRHYENAELCMAFSQNRLGFCDFLVWLYSLCQHWGWDGESARWLETIRVLDCPEETKENIFARARFLTAVCKKNSRLAFV